MLRLCALRRHPTSLATQVFVKHGLGLLCTLPSGAHASASQAALVTLDKWIARRSEAARVAAVDAAGAAATNASPAATAPVSASAGSPPVPVAVPLQPMLPPEPFVAGDVVCLRLGGPTPTTAEEQVRALERARAGLGVIHSVAPRGATKVCSMSTGMMSKNDAGSLTYGDGSAQGPCPLHPLPHLGGGGAVGGSAPTLAPLTRADLRVESNASARGLMLGNSGSVYLTNSLPGKHFVEVDVPPGFSFSSFVVRTEHLGHYSPFVIEVLAGPHAGNLIKIKTTSLPQDAAHTTILNATEVFGFDPRVVKFRVVSWWLSEGIAPMGSLLHFPTVNGR